MDKPQPPGRSPADSETPGSGVETLSGYSSPPPRTVVFVSGQGPCAQDPGSGAPEEHLTKGHRCGQS